MHITTERNRYMADLKTSYMGIGLDNPVVVSSSGITGSLKGVKRCADAGAGAVVLKSMFEEIIASQAENLDSDLVKSDHPEAWGYVTAELGMQMGSKPYLKFIGEAKKAVSIPVIASVNCVTAKWWVPFAQEIEDAGADGLELNISHFPGEPDVSSADIERRYSDIVSEVTGRLSIPVAVKLGPHFTSLMDVLRAVVGAGAKGLVLFNRYYDADIDLDTRRFVNAMVFSCPQEINLPLRWIGLAAKNLDCSIAGSTGVNDARGALKMIMAGADAVQVCSVLYREGIRFIPRIVEQMDAWLTDNHAGSIADIKGAALANTAESDSLLKRIQYIKALNEASSYEFE